MDKYKIIKKLGEGAYGVVLKCVNTQTNQLVAIKKMKGQYANWNQCLQMAEVVALQKLNQCPFIIKLVEMVHNSKENEVNIVFEYCDKNLYQELQERSSSNKLYNQSEIKNLMYQAISAVAYMHQNGYMHRDLKPENFLINPDNMQLKLADFGLAKEVKKNSGNHTEYVSTRWYRAPELVLRSKGYSQSVDIFALGCILSEMYLNRPIFPGTTEKDQLTRIMTVLGTPSKQEWNEGHRLAMNKNISFPTVQAMPLRTHFSQGNRTDMSEEAFDLLEKMFKYDQDKRITAQQCLQHPFFRDVPASIKNQNSSTNKLGMRQRGIPIPPPQQNINNDFNQYNIEAGGMSFAPTPNQQFNVPISRESQKRKVANNNFETNIFGYGSKSNFNTGTANNYNTSESKTNNNASGFSPNIIGSSYKQPGFANNTSASNPNRLDNIARGSGMTYGDKNSAAPLPNRMGRFGADLISSSHHPNPSITMKNDTKLLGAGLGAQPSQTSNTAFAPRMSKYGQGSFAQTNNTTQITPTMSINNIGSKYNNNNMPDHKLTASMNSKPTGILGSSINRRPLPDASGTNQRNNRQQPYSIDDTNPLTTPGNRITPLAGYQNKTNIVAASNSNPMQDDFFEKMMNDNKGSGGMQGPGPTQSNMLAGSNSSGAFSKPKMMMIPKNKISMAPKPGLAAGADIMSNSQSVDLLGHRGTGINNQYEPPSQQRSIYNQPPRTNLGGIGSSILQSPSPVTATSQIPIIKPSSITLANNVTLSNNQKNNANNGPFSNIGQSMILK